MSMKNVILRNKEGVFRIEKINIGVKHSQMVQIAPPGFEPGDEKFIKQLKNGRLEFDYTGKFHAAKKELRPERLLAKRQKWNEQSPLQRFKNAFKAKA